MLFRVRKSITWGGRNYEQGDVVEIPEGNPRLRSLVEQSHHLEYANIDKPVEPQGISVNVIKE